MNRQAESETKQCLSPGTVMALLDEQLGAEEAGRAESHLRACSRCQQLAADLGATAETVAGLRCLDGEAIAAWVDYRAGRARGTVAEAELRRRGEHLRQCQRCRERVAMLAEMCAPQGLWGRVRDLVSVRLGTGPAQPSRGLRWAAAAAVVVAVAICLYLMVPGRRPQPRPTSPRRQVVSTRAPSSRQPQPPSTAARASPGRGPLAALRAGPRPGRLGAPRTEMARAPERGARRGPEAALVPGEGSGRPAIARASSALAQARRRGDAGAEATAALELAGLYHQERDYQSAARYYREAAAAANKAGKTQLRVDALILEGAAAAELGDEARARQQLQLAVELARKAGYVEGEQNALVQLELLGGDRSGGGS